MPTRELEEWRYTDPSSFRIGKVRLPDTPAAVTVPDAARALLENREASATIIQVDGVVAEVSVDESLAARGVVIESLAVAAETHRELVEKYLGSALPDDFGKFAALNASLWDGGIFVHVPRGVRIEKPIRVVRWISQEGVAVFPRTLIVADEAAQIGYVEELGSPDFGKTDLLVRRRRDHRRQRRQRAVRRDAELGQERAARRVAADDRRA